MKRPCAGIQKNSILCAVRIEIQVIQNYLCPVKCLPLFVLLKFYVHESLAEGVSKLWTVYLLQAINNFYQTPIIIYHNVKERLVFSRMTLKTLQIYNTPKLHCYIPLRFEHSVTINYNKLHYVPILSLAYTKKHHPQSFLWKHCKPTESMLFFRRTSEP